MKKRIISLVALLAFCSEYADRKCTCYYIQAITHIQWHNSCLLCHLQSAQ